MSHNLPQSQSITPLPWFRRTGFVAGLLFLLTLTSRLPGLGDFLTSDENTNIFYAGSDVITAFLRGDLSGTYWHFYPGVTMSWLDALGMGGQYLWQRLSGAPLPPFTDYLYGDILSLVVAARLPYAFLTAAAVPAIYLLACQLMSYRAALLGALFLAFDPFYLAHSRVAHGDAPVAVFMSLSALCFFVYLRQMAKSEWRMGGRHRSFWYLIISAVCGGLAALTKAPGQFMAIFVVGLSVVYAGWEVYGSRVAISKVAVRWLIVMSIWGLVSLVTFIALWPAMWVDPLGTIQRMLAETVGKVEEGHLVYFFGQPTLDPGPWFYPYVIPFRMTPVTLVGVILALAFLILTLIPSIVTKPHPLYPVRDALFLFWLFILSLFLFGIFSPKKQDRYLLPLFPLLDLLAALGWWGLLVLITSSFPQKLNPPSSILYLLSSILLIWHAYPVITYYPYYLAYFNPLMGGPQRAAQTTLMGWGEGMEQAAAYLNTKPNADRLYVASTPSQTLLPYFAGTGENFYTNDVAFRADYVVLYLAQMQRLAPSPEIVSYFEAQPPEKVITIQDVTYAKIYPGPKLIRPDIPPEATPANIGLGDVLRLAGYQLPDLQHLTSNLSLTLYWHALAPLPVNYTISVRAKAADGRWLAQQDSWPVDGLLPTSQWRQGDYVTDLHVLEIDSAQIDHFEVVVYNAETSQTLGPPINLPMSNEQ